MRWATRVQEDIWQRAHSTVLLMWVAVGLEAAAMVAVRLAIGGDFGLKLMVALGVVVVAQMLALIGAWRVALLVQAVFLGGMLVAAGVLTARVLGAVGQARFESGVMGRVWVVAAMGIYSALRFDLNRRWMSAARVAEEAELDRAAELCPKCGYNLRIGAIAGMGRKRTCSECGWGRPV